MEVSYDFIYNIDDDYKRNLWKDSSVILLENLINAHIRNVHDMERAAIQSNNAHFPGCKCKENNNQERSSARGKY